MVFFFVYRLPRLHGYWEPAKRSIAILSSITIDINILFRKDQVYEHFLRYQLHGVQAHWACTLLIILIDIINLQVLNMMELGRNFHHHLDWSLEKHTQDA